MELKGIHHVSAITANAPANYDFYTRILGLRLIKKTVNQDEVSMYHLFYGDEYGNPGTELTFFEIPMAGRNRDGNNSISAISLRVPNDQALHYWKERLTQFEVDHEDRTERGGRMTLAFRDFEGQRIILVSDENNTGVPSGQPWPLSPVPVEVAITGLGPVHLTVPHLESTEKVMTELLGFRRTSTYSNTTAPDQPDIVILETGQGGSGAEVHIETRTDLGREHLGRGGVHHVAFRVEDDAELNFWIEKLDSARLSNSGYVDRFYFHSLYFREANGILFEFATDGPGFATDEEPDKLGETLALPPFLEPRRGQIEAMLKPLQTSRDN